MKDRIAYDARSGTIVKLYSNESQSEYKTNTKEIDEMAKKKKILLSVDGGNKATKVYYEIDGETVFKVEKSCIDIVENADDTYTHAGLVLANDIAYNFNTSKTVIETSKENKKHNNFHFGLVLKQLIDVSDTTGCTRFDLAITTPLDGFNNLLDEIKTYYNNNKKFEIVSGDKKKTIEIDHIIVRPEMVSALNTIGAVIKEGVVCLLEIGGLNHQFLKLEDFRTDLKDDSFIGEKGYNYIEENLPQFMRNNGTKSYKDSDIMRYVETSLGKDEEKDMLIQKFFTEVYVPVLIEDLDKKSVSVEYDKIFLGGGTSERFKKFLIKGFKDNGAKSVKVIDNAIFANAIGAYKKAKVDIAKLEKENK